jgi:hypothetical protein
MSASTVSLEASHRSFIKGMIIPYAGRLGDLDLKEWAPCDGTALDKGAPNLSGLFLLGTDVWAEIKHPAGSPSHSHSYTVNTPNMMIGGNGDARAYNVDHQSKPPACCGLDHWHHITGSTDATAWTPPSLKVMFIMKL